MQMKDLAEAFVRLTITPDRIKFEIARIFFLIFPDADSVKLAQRLTSSLLQHVHDQVLVALVEYWSKNASEDHMRATIAYYQSGAPQRFGMTFDDPSSIVLTVVLRNKEQIPYAAVRKSVAANKRCRNAVCVRKTAATA